MTATRIGGLFAAGVIAVALVAGPGTHPTALAARHASAALPAERVTMVVVPGVHLGPDKKMHDAFTPTDITAVAGQKIIVTVYNYDTGMHSFTAPALGLNVMIPGARQNGVPAVKTFSFTVKKAGSYKWLCVMPCDDLAKGWAMRHENYMAGFVTVERP
jgi:heme/copper-type cytochrome/quinol oxidase subunit 2